MFGFTSFYAQTERTTGGLALSRVSKTALVETTTSAKTGWPVFVSLGRASAGDFMPLLSWKNLVSYPMIESTIGNFHVNRDHAIPYFSIIATVFPINKRL